MPSAVMLLVLGAMLLRGGRQGYDAFLQGGRRGLESALSLLPALCAMTLFLGLMNASGVTEMLCRLLAPLTGLLGLPEEVTPMLILRPLTGSGSLAALKEIIRLCGVDSRPARIAAALMGSSETIFYTMTVYLSAADTKRLPGVIPISLISYLTGAWVLGRIL